MKQTRLVILCGLLAAVLLALFAVACRGSSARDMRDQGAGGTTAAEVVGRGSAGPTEREQPAPVNEGIIQTQGLPTIVFVDADG
jgi:hypothetical protein